MAQERPARKAALHALGNIKDYLISRREAVGVVEGLEVVNVDVGDRPRAVPPQELLYRAIYHPVAWELRQRVDIAGCLDHGDLEGEQQILDRDLPDVPAVPRYGDGVIDMAGAAAHGL